MYGIALSSLDPRVLVFTHSVRRDRHRRWYCCFLVLWWWCVVFGHTIFPVLTIKPLVLCDESIQPPHEAAHVRVFTDPYEFREHSRNRLPDVPRMNSFEATRNMKNVKPQHRTHVVALRTPNTPE